MTPKAHHSKTKNGNTIFAGIPIPNLHSSLLCHPCFILVSMHKPCRWCKTSSIFVPLFAAVVGCLYYKPFGVSWFATICVGAALFAIAVLKDIDDGGITSRAFDKRFKVAEDPEIDYESDGDESDGGEDSDIEHGHGE